MVEVSRRRSGAPRRVLWVSNETPDPSGQGGQRRQYHQIRTLVRAGHQVVVSTLNGPQDPASIAALTEIQRATPMLRGRIPNPAHRVRLRRLAARRWDRIVVAHTESWPTWAPLLQLSSAPTLVDMHNVLSAWHAAAGRTDVAEQWRAVEDQIIRSAAVSVCSTKEAQSLGDTGGTLLVVPHGLDPTEWALPPEPSATPVIKLFGNWGWEPNHQGLHWFLTQVWPRLATAGVLRCEIAGAGVDPSLLSLIADDDVRLIWRGRVPSISHFLRDAWVVGVPVIQGVGAPVKFAEALASGIPVVATTDGAPSQDASYAFVSDSSDAWVRHLTSLVASPHPHRMQALDTRTLVLRELTWEHTTTPVLDWVER